MTKIQLLRESQGLTRTELARRAGLKANDVKQAEELSEMYVSTSLSLARALGVRPSTIEVKNSTGLYAREKRTWR